MQGAAIQKLHGLIDGVQQAAFRCRGPHRVFLGQVFLEGFAEGRIIDLSWARMVALRGLCQSGWRYLSCIPRFILCGLASSGGQVSACAA